MAAQTVRHDYVTQNGKVVRETITTDGTVTTVMDFIYDASGNPYAMIYTNGTAEPVTYYYLLNMQGDVVALMTASGAYVAQYTYDAWGNTHTSSGEMAEINPLRYRGYYYDTETGFYYLQSRYYDPANRRFINADGYASTGQGFIGCNMFAYCNGNPVNNSDCAGAIVESCTYDGGRPVASRRYDEYKRVVEAYAASGTKLYYTEWAALMDWRNTYLPLSRNCEYVTYLYSCNTPLGTRYYLTSTYKGMQEFMFISANVIGGTIILEIRDTIVGGNFIAQVHTHPDPGAGYHNDFPSYNSGIYGGDRIAYELFNYPKMYVIPYTRCEGVPLVIEISDPNTWCPDYTPE